MDNPTRQHTQPKRTTEQVSLRVLHTRPPSLWTGNSVSSYSSIHSCFAFFQDRGSTFFARTLRIDYELQTAYDAGIDRSTPIIPEAEGEGGGKAGRTLRPGDQDVRLDWSMPEGESDAKAGQADEKVTALDKKVPARRSSIIYPSKR
ncbi:uncharacterized protein MYCGRDRAFT_106529, partial [Zymoseptoria tritici IPO323]